MFDLDKLSYKAYGNLVIIVLLIIATLINLFPFSLIELILCIVQIPFYLVIRASFDEPIHAIGLNICFVVTILFFTLLITMRGHIVCSKDGVIYDTFDCRDREVESVWLVK